MKKSYRKPKMKPYNRADNQMCVFDYMYPGRKGYIALDEPEEQVSLRAIRQDMMNKAVQQMEENQRSLPAGRRNRHELGLKERKEHEDSD